MARPVTLLDSLAAWLATAGVLLLLAGGVIVGSAVWFASLLFAPGEEESGTPNV